MVIRFGVRAPLSLLEQGPQIRIRQALIRRLRVLVPAIFLGAAASAVAAAALGGAGPELALRLAGVLSLLAFILVTLLGTVPINKGMLTWRPDAPPADWQQIIRRWERLDTVRCGAALLAFALFVVAVAR